MKKNIKDIINKEKNVKEINFQKKESEKLLKEEQEN